MRRGAGEYDRRITIEIAGESRDEAGDTIKAFPSEVSGVGQSVKRWAKRSPLRQNELNGTDTQAQLREQYVDWLMRFDSFTAVVPPETSRVLWKSGGVTRIYQIVGVESYGDRHDEIKLATVYRPDLRGAVGPL